MYRRSRYASEQGYTLIELLLYVVIVGTLLTSMTVFFGTVTESRIKNQSISEVNEQGTAAMELILQTIRNANSITAPAIAASGTSLTLTVPTASSSPTVFQLSGTTLQIQEGLSPNTTTTALTTDDVQVTGLTFKNLTRSGTPGIVQVSFTLSRTNLTGRNEYDYQKTFTSSAEVTW